MNINPKLSTKGRILVAIPLSVQIISVSVLGFMLNTAEKETARVQLSREITNESLLIAKKIYDAEYVLYRYMEAVKAEEGRYPRLSSLSAALSDEIPGLLAELKKMVAGRKEESRIAASMTYSCNLLLHQMRQMKRSLDKGEGMQGVFVTGALMAATMGPLNQISMELDELIKLQKKDAVLEKEVRDYRTLVQTLLYISVAINIIVVVVLLSIFNRGTISRLLVLMDNTRRLSNKQPLNPVLTGNDEIAELDRVFHEVTNAMLAAQMRERELLDMKKQITAMVSHDLRAPLTSLQMTLNMLSRTTYGELNAQGLSRVKSSEESVSRLIRMINDLLDLEKLEAGKMDMQLQPVPLSVLVARSIEAVQELAAGKEISIDYDEKDLEVKGDGDRLIQVFVNLLSNAIKFSPEKASIRVLSDQESEFMRLQIIDSGPGVPAEAQKQIFERYKQIEGNSAQEKKGGTGLGLAIAKIIIEQHGGSIGVISESGTGSIFWVKLPLAEDTDESPG